MAHDEVQHRDGFAPGREKEVHMATGDFHKALTSTRELEITVTGRQSGQQISLPVWFVHEGDTLYLLPVKGSDSHWYKNIRRTPSMTLSARGTHMTANADPITDPDKVREVVEKFRAKYGAADVRRYYSKFDVGVEVRLA
jgi:deazaflavin-dependent oxidoreductase (nitroreductase family)